jgi:hypothetical protein
MSNLVMRFAAVFFTTLSFMLMLCKPGFAQEALGGEGDPKPLKVFVLAGNRTCKAMRMFAPWIT